MAKITSKLQVTIPKAIAQRYAMRPGDEIEFVPAGDAVRVLPRGRRASPGAQERLRFFDMATRRQKQREASVPRGRTRRGRGWTREELYERGRAG